MLISSLSFQYQSPHATLVGMLVAGLGIFVSLLLMKLFPIFTSLSYNESSSSSSPTLIPPFFILLDAVNQSVVTVVIDVCHLPGVVPALLNMFSIELF